jgi:hypothetical protein
MNEKPWVFCSCGNLIRIGGRGTKVRDRVYEEHPACGREPNRVQIPSTAPAPGSPPLPPPPTP